MEYYSNGRLERFKKITGAAIVKLTFPMPTTAVKIMGAIQGTLGGPKLVHAKPKRPIGKHGITISDVG